MTKDERFLLELYLRLSTLSPEEEGINPTVLGKEMGYKDLLIKEVLKGLGKANLVKFISDEEVVLTERGKVVATAISARQKGS